MNITYQDVFNQKVDDEHTYDHLARAMSDLIRITSDSDLPATPRLLSSSVLRVLVKLVSEDTNLKNFWPLFKDTKPSTTLNVGFDHIAVSKLVHAMVKHADLAKTMGKGFLELEFDATDPFKNNEKTSE